MNIKLVKIVVISNIMKMDIYAIKMELIGFIKAMKLCGAKNMRLVKYIRDVNKK